MSADPTRAALEAATEAVRARFVRGDSEFSGDAAAAVAAFLRVIGASYADTNRPGLAWLLAELAGDVEEAARDA